MICDNANTHKPETARRVKAYLAAWGGRVVLHYLPLYAPECNPIERVWWRLREAITRNHGCKSLPGLVDLVLAWLTERRSFRVKGSVYQTEQSRGSRFQPHEAA